MFRKVAVTMSRWLIHARAGVSVDGASGSPNAITRISAGGFHDDCGVSVDPTMPIAEPGMIDEHGDRVPTSERDILTGTGANGLVDPTA
jgi:hypothetical protein